MASISSTLVLRLRHGKILVPQSQPSPPHSAKGYGHSHSLLRAKARMANNQSNVKAMIVVSGNDHSSPLDLPPAEAAISISPPPPRDRILSCSSSSLGPPSLHPLYETVRSECELWILSIARPPSPSHRQFLLDCLLPRLPCRLFPFAPLIHRLCHATKLIASLTLADDIDSDAGAATDSAAVDLWSTRVLAVLHDGCACYPGEGGGVAAEEFEDRIPVQLLESLAEIWGDISGEMPPHWRQRYIRFMREHFQAVSCQSAVRSSRQPLTVAQFMAIRRPASGLQMVLELGMYAMDLQDSRVLHHPLLWELRSLVIDYMCICNDVVSGGVEMANGDSFNLPHVLYSCGAASSMEDAMARTVEMADDVHSRCLEVLRQIRSDPELNMMEEQWQPTVEAYVETMVACMTGNLEWCYETARYRLPAVTTTL